MHPNAVRRAAHAWHPSAEYRPELARVQVPPAPLDMIVDRAHRSAVWASMRGPRGGPDPHIDLARLHAELDALDQPWGRQPQNCLIQRPVFRPTSRPKGLARSYTPTLFPEEPHFEGRCTGVSHRRAGEIADAGDCGMHMDTWGGSKTW